MGFVTKYSKSYVSTSDFQFRREIFKRNLAEIQRKNGENGNYQLDVNFFGDWTPAEQGNMFKYTPVQKAQNLNNRMIITNPTLQDVNVDWRLKGAVTPVKNQLTCGANWAFASASALESAHFLSSGTLSVLSTQQLIDCIPPVTGCTAAHTIEDVMSNATTTPVALEADYTFNGGKCGIEQGKGGVTVKETIFVEADNPD